MKREDLFCRSSLQDDGMKEYIISLGGNPIGYMHKAGIDTTPFKGKIQFVRWASVCNLFEITAAELDEPYFGLKWSLNQPKDLRHLGPILPTAKLLANLRQIILVIIDYLKIHTNGVRFNFHEDIENNNAIITSYFHPLSPPCRQFSEFMSATMTLLGYQFLEGFKPKYISFQHAAPKDMTLYHEIFGCPIEFNAPQMQLVFDSSVLEVEKTDKLIGVMASAVQKYLNWRFIKNRKAKSSISTMLAETLPTILGVRKSDLNSVAELMDMHPKKLQRLLNQEGTSFAQTFDEVRHQIAARLLEESDISILRMAEMLDYSSDRTFTKAAKRWFGMNPTEYRKHIRKM